MQGNRTFLEGNDIHPLFFQQDVNTDVTGDWMSMVNYNRAYVWMHKAGSEDVDALGLQILQATSAAGAGAKALAVSKCWYKAGDFTAAAQGVWTEKLFSTPADWLGFGSALTGGTSYATTSNQRVCDDVNTGAVSILVEILGTDLDLTNGFKFITAHFEGDLVDNSCLISAVWIGHLANLAGQIPPSPLS